MIIEIMYILSGSSLGIFLGAQICEGALMVPHWKTMSADDFFEMHKTVGKKIYKFFAPLTIISTLIPLATAIYAFYTKASGWQFASASGIFTIIFFSTYFLFFKRANKAFSEASISSDDLPLALNRWGTWHWGRIFFECLAFLFMLCALAES